MANPDNAGPYTIGVDGVMEPNDTVPHLFSEVEAGPENKAGFLRKVFGDRGGMDFLFVVNASSNVVQISTKSGNSFLPPATSQTLDSGIYTSATVTNLGSTNINTGDDDQVKVIVGNSDRNTDNGPSFSPVRAVEDTIPGVSL